jgi:phosphoenolpyruvate carboxykinase (ATP)
MGVFIPSLEKMTIEAFIESFHKIIEYKKAHGLKAYHDNPPYEVLRKQAEFYGENYKNGSLGWASNIWSRSQANSAVVEDSGHLDSQHKLLMRSALEYILAPNPLIKVDGALGHHPRVKFHCRIWTDSRYPDLPLRWRELVYPADPSGKPDMEMLVLPGLWAPATMPGTKTPLFVIRFPEHWFTLISVSSYQGEVKKGALTHWIYYVYLKGGTGVHAGTKQFVVKDVNGKWRRIGMLVWGLTGSGKSTHSMYVFDKSNADWFKNHGLDVLSLVKEQKIKNDDIVALFEDCCLGSEKGAWTKTEDVNERQIAIYKAGMSPRALHENTGVGEDGYPNFMDEILEYRGLPNRNARTVMYLADMEPYFDGNIDIEFPPNLGIFISPGYLTDYAWVKIQDIDFAAAVLAAGRTVGHPAQSTEGIAEEKYEPLYNPFIAGKSATNSDHTYRFKEILLKRKERAEKKKGEPFEIFLFNTTGKVGTKYVMDKGKAKPVFEEIGGRRKAVGGTGPSIEETELFILQAARGAVKYKPHPIWGEKVLVPDEVEGLPKSRLAELDPFTYRSRDEMIALLKMQVEATEEVFRKFIPGLDDSIFKAMRF